MQQYPRSPRGTPLHTALFVFGLLCFPAAVMLGGSKQVTATPATLTQPYAKLCFAPEWWLVKGYLLDTGTIATAQPLGTLAEANSIFCTGTTDTPAVHRHWQADADRTLERLKLEMAELPLNGDLLVAISRVHVLQKIVSAL